MMLRLLRKMESVSYTHLDVYKRQASGRTSFLIAHRLSTIRDCDLILLIENGKIVEKGSHEELMRLDGSYAKMYRTQMGIAG